MNIYLYILLVGFLNMLAKIAPRFVISRVIQNSYLAENQAIELLKVPFGNHNVHFGYI